MGIITLEDIIEALMDREIEDEMDSDDDNERKNNNTHSLARAEQKKLREIKRHDVT